MFTESTKLPPDSRIWIFQADRELSDYEAAAIAIKTKSFLNDWTAHSQELKASYELRFNIFLILMIDEKQALASGCSIDKSTHFIQQLEKELSVSFMNRQVYAFREDNKIKFAKRKEFESLIEEGYLNGETIVFNNLIQTKGELETQWQIPMKESWHAAIR